LTQPVRISVVVPTLGRIGTLRRVLARLDTQTVGGDQIEVILAADAEADADSLDELDLVPARRPYAVRLVRASIAGASAARNAGWRAAQAPLLLFLDDDILPDSQLIEEHLAWHAETPEPEVGVLGHVRWARELRVSAFMRWLEHGIQFNYPSIEGEETVWGNFYTANVSVKRALVESVGGFDETRLPYGYEDLDLALRMHQSAGFRLRYNRRASAEHVHAMDIEFWRRRLPRVARSELRFVELHPEVPAYFHELFQDAASRPAVSGWIDLVARFTPRRIPVVGRRVWSRADLFYRQTLAPSFLAAWEEAAQVSERRTPVSSGGSPPGGPK
jgi:GT2 family glycosyltransferase